MNHDGSLRGTRQFKLAAKRPRLYVPWRMIVVIVEPDFPPGDDSRVPRQPVEFRVMRIGRVLRLVRMDPHRGINPIMPLGVRNRGPELHDWIYANRKSTRLNSSHT